MLVSSWLGFWGQRDYLISSFRGDCSCENGNVKILKYALSHHSSLPLSTRHLVFAEELFSLWLQMNVGMNAWWIVSNKPPSNPNLLQEQTTMSELPRVLEWFTHRQKSIWGWWVIHKPMLILVACCVTSVHYTSREPPLLFSHGGIRACPV